MGCCCSTAIDLNSEVNLFHFELHRTVGKGAFGKVRVVEHRRSNQLYALKYINKSQCIRRKAVANIIQERRLLEEIDHPFIVNLRYAFQDDDNCFFVLDLMLGGDLRFHLERYGSFKEEIVVFWVAEVATALEYLHRQRICHRDLKPDNILLDSDGHAHITDFNVAIHYSEKRLHTSVAGSMAYMAPEVIGQRGYSWAVDWWSLGITAYELLFHKRPFGGRDEKKMTNSILKDPLTFPEEGSRCSEAGLSALKGFIDRDPSTRLGCRSNGFGFEDIRKHSWFSSINWDALQAKELQSPYVPDLNQANFDISHELDEFFMVEKPLKHSKRKANVDLEKMNPELRQLEDHFTVYDFSSSEKLSYYPDNQVMGTEFTGRTYMTSTSDTLSSTATIVEPSQAGTTLLESRAGCRPTIPASRGLASM